MRLPGAVNVGVQSAGRHSIAAAGTIGGAIAQAVGRAAQTVDIWAKATRDSEEAEALADLKMREIQARNNHTTLLMDVPGHGLSKGMAGGSKIRADGTYRSYDVGSSMYGGAMDKHISEATKGLTFPQSKRFANAVRRLRTIGSYKVNAYHLKARRVALNASYARTVEMTIAAATPDTLDEAAEDIVDVYRKAAKNGAVSNAVRDVKTREGLQQLQFNVADRTLMGIAEDVLAQRITPEEARARAVIVSKVTKSSAVLTDKDKMVIRKRSVSVRKAAATADDKANKQRVAAAADQKVTDVREAHPDSMDKQRAAINAIKDQALKDETRTRWEDTNKEDAFLKKASRSKVFEQTGKTMDALVRAGKITEARKLIPEWVTEKERKAYNGIINRGHNRSDVPEFKRSYYNLMTTDPKAFAAVDFRQPDVAVYLSEKTIEYFQKAQQDLKRDGAEPLVTLEKQISVKLDAMGLKKTRRGDAKQIDIFRGVVMDRIRLEKQQRNIQYVPSVEVDKIIDAAAKDFTRSNWWWTETESFPEVQELYEDAGIDYREAYRIVAAREAANNRLVTPEGMRAVLNDEAALKDLLERMKQ